MKIKRFLQRLIRPQLGIERPQQSTNTAPPISEAYEESVHSARGSWDSSLDNQLAFVWNEEDHLPWRHVRDTRSHSVPPSPTPPTPPAPRTRTRSLPPEYFPPLPTSYFLAPSIDATSRVIQSPSESSQEEPNEDRKPEPPQTDDHLPADSPSLLILSQCLQQDIQGVNDAFEAFNFFANETGEPHPSSSNHVLDLMDQLTELEARLMEVDSKHKRALEAETVSEEKGGAVPGDAPHLDEAPPWSDTISPWSSEDLAMEEKDRIIWNDSQIPPDELNAGETSTAVPRPEPWDSNVDMEEVMSLIRLEEQARLDRDFAIALSSIESRGEDVEDMVASDVFPDAPTPENWTLPSDQSKSPPWRAFEDDSRTSWVTEDTWGTSRPSTIPHQHMPAGSDEEKGMVDVVVAEGKGKGKARANSEEDDISERSIALSSSPPNPFPTFPSAPPTICGICLEPFRVVRFPVQASVSATSSSHLPKGLTLACEHSYCISCAATHVKMKLEVGVSQQWPIRCPECAIDAQPIRQEDVERILHPLEMEPYYFRKLIDEAPGVFCPNEKCSEFLHSPNAFESDGQNTCPRCKQDICLRCKMVWHKGLTCEEYQSLPPDERAYEDRLFRDLADKKGWGSCPQCGIHTEKISGCNHISCLCGAHYCYRCSGPYDVPGAHCGDHCEKWTDRKRLEAKRAKEAKLKKA